MDRPARVEACAAVPVLLLAGFSLSDPPDCGIEELIQ